MADYKSTVNLPQTDFAMKADLAKREPQMLQWWQDNDIYNEMRRVGKGRPRFVLHDGPPYANGNDPHRPCAEQDPQGSGREIARSRWLRLALCAGLGLPRPAHRAAVEKKHGRVGQKLDARAFRAACRAYAEEQIDLQRRDFKRLGVMGEWDNPYKTMAPRYEAQQIRALGKVIANGHFYAGAKPVYWCLDCRSALAEAEVEYEDHTSPAIDVAFHVDDAADFARRIGVALDDAAPPSIVIWTTTPWTLPANEAVTLRADFPYVLVEFQRGNRLERVVLAEGLAAASLARYGVFEGEGRTLARFEGRVLEGLLLQHPFQGSQGAGDPRRPCDARRRHRRRAHRAGAWPRRLQRRPSLQPARGEPGADRRPLQGRHRRWSVA